MTDRRNWINIPKEGTIVLLIYVPGKGPYSEPLMRVLGRWLFHKFRSEHGDARSQADAWLAEAEDASWKSPADVKERYPSASLLSGNRVLFNLKGNRYRLEVKIDYEREIVLVKRLGTHAEYSRWVF